MFKISCFFWKKVNLVGLIPSHSVEIRTQPLNNMVNAAPDSPRSRRGSFQSKRVEKLSCRPAIRRHSKTLLFALNGYAGAGTEDAIDLADIMRHVV